MTKLKCKYCGGELKHYPNSKYFEYVLLNAPAQECRTSLDRVVVSMGISGDRTIGQHFPLTKEQTIQRLLEKTDIH